MATEISAALGILHRLSGTLPSRQRGQDVNLFPFCTNVKLEWKRLRLSVLGILPQKDDGREREISHTPRNHRERNLTQTALFH